MSEDNIRKYCLRDDCEIKGECGTHRQPAAPLPIYPMHTGRECPFYKQRPVDAHPPAD